MFNMHAVSTTREGEVTLGGRAYSWQGTLKGNTKRQIIMQLVQQRDPEADLFCIAGDTNIKTFADARQVSDMFPGVQLHAARASGADDFIFVWGNALPEEQNLDWMPAEFRGGVVGYYTKSGNHHVVCCALAKSQVVQAPEIISDAEVELDLSAMPGAQEHFDLVIAHIADSMQRQKNELEEDKPEVIKPESLADVTAPLPPLPPLDYPEGMSPDEHQASAAGDIDEFQVDYDRSSEGSSNGSDDDAADSRDASAHLATGRDKSGKDSGKKDEGSSSSSEDSSPEGTASGRPKPQGPRCLLHNTAIKCGDHILIVETRTRAEHHFRGISYARACIINLGYGHWDDVLETTVLQSPGITKCKEMHYNIWANELDNPENGVLERLFIEEHGGQDNREWRRRVQRRYNVAMHVRFGARGLRTFWKYGVVTEQMLDAIRVVIRARQEARREAVAAHSRVAPTHLAPAEVAQDMDKERQKANQRARRARHQATTAKNRVRREDAARRPGGACAWCYRQQNPYRSECLVCEKLICDRCTYWDSEDCKYLLCNVCFQRRGHSGPLEIVGRVDRHPKPSRCDKALDADDMTGHVEGGVLVECVECCRWLCARCACDDGPPHRCRLCPELQRRSGGVIGISLVNPLRPGDRGCNQGKGGQQTRKGKGKRITRDVAEWWQQHADELTAKGALVAAHILDVSQIQ